MLKNYFLIGWRNIVRNRGYAFINIAGLAMGMAVAMLIGLWIYDELSYDKSFKNHNRIARVLQNQALNGKIETWFGEAMQLGPELREHYGSNFDQVVIASFPGNSKLAYVDKSVTRSGSFMEDGAAAMLALSMIDGTWSGLNDMHSIFISRTTANALFGDEAAMDKIIEIDNNLEVRVTGVYEDLPANSSFSNLDFILPWQLLVTTANLEQRVGWGNSWFQCFVQVAEHADMETVSAMIKDVKKNRAPEEGQKFNPQLFLQPMKRWHLYSEFENGVCVGGEVKYVWTFGVVGAFVLMLACINFMNLNTAQSERRSKEVGIRKTIGSVRVQLVTQFFMESTMVALMAFFVALVIVQLMLPWFNEVAGKQITIVWNSLGFWFSGIGFAIITGCLAGTYPALFLSSFKPIKVLRGTFRVGRLAIMPRKVLVVLQFTVSIALIVGTIVIFKQIQFAQGRPLGYDISGIVTLPIKTGTITKHYEAFRNDMLSTGVVNDVALSENPVTQTYVTNSGFQWTGKDPNMAEEIVTVCVTPEFGNTIGWAIVEGRDFSKDMASDSSGFIVNEAAVAYMGLQNPVGEVIRWNNNGEWKIIGVVKNIISQSPYAQVKPMFLFLRSNRLSFLNFTVINIKLAPSAAVAEALAKVESVYKKYDPDNAFDYQFADQDFAAKFNNEKRLGKLLFVFTVLAILISGLGLFGLASFVAEQRTKEIGIRKILGASMLQLWQILSFDFVKLVCISSFIAIPTSLYLMGDWLLQFELRISLTWEIFALASVGAVLITLLIVSFHTIKASVRNPVNSLRAE